MEKNTLDPLIPKCLVDSLKNTFAIQASAPLEILDIKAAKADTRVGTDVVAVIGIHSSTLEGSIALCFPTATFLGIINGMLGENYQEVTAENSDAAGELLNILYGGARVKVNEGGYDFLPAIPSVLRGEKLQVNHGSTSMVVRIDCKSPHGLLYVEISMRKVAKKMAA